MLGDKKKWILGIFFRAMNKANLYEIDKVHNKYLANKEVVYKYYVIVYWFNKYLHIELQVCLESTDITN